MWPFALTFPELSPNDVGSESTLSDDSIGHGVYDYIIRGGGTGGCILANRLSEDPSVTVLLVERGASSNSYGARIPLLSADFTRRNSPAARWPTAPLANLDNRTLDVVAGHCLGGNSRINACLYTRGAASEFNRWSENGRKGWSYDELEPYFIKSEGILQRPVPKHHGGDGPWQHRSFSRFYLDSYARCAEATESMGMPIIADIHSPDAPAVCSWRTTVTIDKDGYRCSTADAFLPASLAIQRSRNLKTCSNTIVTSLDIRTTPGGKLKAAGIFFQQRDSDGNKVYHARARREIILCAGTIGTPQILMLSGLGPKDHLHEMGIDVKKDLSGVGNNLQDHLSISTIYRIPMTDSFHIIEKKTLRAMWELVKYMIWGDGLFLMPIHQLSVFTRSSILTKDFTIETRDPAQLDARDPKNICDIELMVIPYNSSDYPIDLNDGVLSFLGALLQPRSTGTIRLASTDAKVLPAVDLGYFSDPADYLVLRKAVLLSKRIAETMRKSGYRVTDYDIPASESDEDLDVFIRKNARTSYHYASTCRMAPEDDVRPGVVDDELRVYGVGGLRIADASIFPDVMATHLQVPVGMVAEKCADMIKGAWVQ